MNHTRILKLLGLAILMTCALSVLVTAMGTVWLRPVLPLGASEPAPISSPSVLLFDGPLRVHPTNPRYFTDDTGRAIYLTGSHYWPNFVDDGPTNPPPAFDYEGYLDFLTAHHHNFIRLWRAENVQGGEQSDAYWFYPLPYQRTGPGVAVDGNPRFDVTQFDPSYFERLRVRVVAAKERGIYVSIMLFDGWSVESKLPTHHPWIGHPFNQNNNINRINGDLDGNGNGEETHTLAIPAITALQEAYVRQVIDTVNDLDNVLYEISNESQVGSYEWQYHMINYIHSYESTKAKQHPVGMTVEYPEGDNAVLYASPADWIAPSGDIKNPPQADGAKVEFYDTDHFCFPCGDRVGLWKSFTNGANFIHMDHYDGLSTGRGADPAYATPNPDIESLRLNMGYALSYANRMNLAAMEPHDDLCSSEYCLANPAVSGAEYLVYLPKGRTVKTILRALGINKTPALYLPSDSLVTVDLSATTGLLVVEWLNPQTGEVTESGTVTGGNTRTFVAPFSGDAVLYLFPN